MDPREIIEQVLIREGGFVNHPADKGGATNYGITQASLSDFRGRPASVSDVQALTKDEARTIYKTRYVDPFIGLYDNRLLALVVDSAVNHGVRRATKWLQEALGVEADGIIGPATRRAMGLAQTSVVYKVFLRRRIVFYGTIIKNDPKQAVFAEGWMRRVAEFI